MNEIPDNLKIYDESWDGWLDMRMYGPASRWLRVLIGDACAAIDPAPQTVHDVGCGEGTITAMLAQRFPQAQVRGSDFSKGAIDCAQRLPRLDNLTFVHDPDNRNLDTTADLVCAFEVIEHIEDWQPFLARLAGSARRFLLLSTPTGRMRPFEVNMGHMRNFRHGELETALHALGFEPVDVAYAGFPFYSPLYRDFCQLTNAGAAQFTRGRFSAAKRLACTGIYGAFRFLSSQRRGGDQFVGLFARSVVPPP